MEQENKNFGVLFDNITLLSEEHLEVMLSTMDKEYALYYLIESVKSNFEKLGTAYTSGLIWLILKASLGLS